MQSRYSIPFTSLSSHFKYIYILLVFFVLFRSTSSGAQELLLGIYLGYSRDPMGPSPLVLLGCWAGQFSSMQSMHLACQAIFAATFHLLYV